MGSVKLAKTLGLKIPLLAIKGYSIDVYHKEKGLENTIINASKQAAFVRMPGMTRITAFGDVEGTNWEINET